MGLTYVWARVANPAKPVRAVRLKFLLDSGAVYSVVPEDGLAPIGHRSAQHAQFHPRGWQRH